MAIINDHYSEDKGYNRTHRQTEGGLQAYARGEKPLSKWDKKTIIKNIFKKLEELKTKDPETYLRISKHVKLAGGNQEDLEKRLQELTLMQLIDKFLVFTGVHYTGNYYRYTEFYGIANSKTLEKIIKQEIYPEPFYVQLKLFTLN